ncbi:hypothetical protein [Intrasporangium flavum]|uniref:hypothetical protein n=1 Tax=Intrasporangium flavum TaxID=1428657 RepID=UPI001A96F28D|nr:hypothetical protein [Intrasporangium flavum]
MPGREALRGMVALLVAVAALTACERSAAPSGPPDTPVASSATTQAGASEPTTVTASTPAPSTGSAVEPTGAGGGGGGGGTGGGGSGSGNGNGGNGGGGAVGSPIDVPTIPDPHTSMDGLRSAIEGAFVTACGGDTLCVQLEYGDGACLLGYSPSTTAARGSTVTVLTESQEECDAANNGPPEPTDEPTVEPTQEPSDSSSTGDSSGGSSGGSTDGSTSVPATGQGAGS